MAILAAAGRIAATVVAMVGTRLELAAVEFQEDARRLLGALAWTLLALFLACSALLFVALFVIVLFWDSFRLQAVAGVAIVFGLGAALILMKVRAGMKAQSSLFSNTLAELRSDVAYLRGHAVPTTTHAAADADAGAHHG
ncbi:phage holin family protein [Massilia sp. 9096]|uniref:phage holin family protein n=1 Tax=Massilia sp. 9096 TaxID=1500894 RepID=UPI0006910C5C|nr:phage holin family protein [Massilia sp. 9096]